MCASLHAQCAVPSRRRSKCESGIDSQHLIMRPRRLDYDVLHAVAGDRLEEPHWRRAQSTPKAHPATLLEIKLHRVTITAWAPDGYQPVVECV